MTVPARITVGLAVALSDAASAAAPGGAPAVGAGSVLQMTLGLGIVLLAIVAVAWTLRRVFHMPAGLHGQIRVVGGVSMGARERVVLVQVGQTQLLLGVAPGRIQTLHVLDQPLPLEERAGVTAVAGASFSRQLMAAIRRGPPRDAASG